jgi:uncharacterized protein YlxW (UPF0749 family)
MNKQTTVSLFLVSVFLGGMLTVQFSAVHRPKPDSNVGDNVQLTAELTQEKDRQQFFYDEKDKLEEQIRSYQGKQGDRKEMVKAMADELENVKKLAGMTEVKGNGITITIQDSVDAVANAPAPITKDMLMNMGPDLYQLVNYLNGNAAQAISVNNHRLVSTSSIRSISATDLQVNTIMIDPSKIVIKAVGNIDQMKIGMNQFPAAFRSMGKSFDIQEIKDGSLVIPSYDLPVDFKYAKPEGDKSI